MPTKKKKLMHEAPMMKKHCAECRLWSIVAGIIMIIFGIALYAKILTLEYTIAILIILMGVGAIIGGGLRRHSH